MEDIVSLKGAWTLGRSGHEVKEFVKLSAAGSIALEFCPAAAGLTPR
jgi:hypothetical protein